MSEEVKYKVGDEVLLKATVKELSESSCILDFGLLGKTVHYQATIAQMDINKKVKIPRFVADIIVSLKENDMTLYDALNIYSFDDDINEIDDWVQENSDTFARAWLDGYDIEKEKMYTAKLKLTDEYLAYDNDNVEYYFTDEEMASKFTEEEFKKMKFWDNPAFEIKEAY